MAIYKKLVGWINNFNSKSAVKCLFHVQNCNTIGKSAINSYILCARNLRTTKATDLRCMSLKRYFEILCMHTKRNLTNYYSSRSSSCTRKKDFWKVSFRQFYNLETSLRSNGQTDMSRSSRLDMLIKNIYTF